MGQEGDTGEKGEIGLKGKEGPPGSPGLTGVRVSHLSLCLNTHTHTERESERWRSCKLTFTGSQISPSAFSVLFSCRRVKKGNLAKLGKEAN